MFWGALFVYWWLTQGTASAFNPPMPTGPPPNALTWRGQEITFRSNELLWR